MRSWIARRALTGGEEIANALTHGIGAALATAGLVVLVVLAGEKGDVWRLTALAVYGASVVFMYLCSTLYHAFRHPTIKRYFRLMDHVSIYLLIAGTYTPVTLFAMGGAWGWTLFGLIWAMALGGIVSKIFLLGKFEIVSVAFYLAMGWLVVIAIRPMIELLERGLLIWIFAGGLAYTLGVVFYALTGVRYSHAIWHLFVLAGSVCHFVGIALYIATV